MLKQLLGVICCAMLAQSAAAATLAPHRAVYDLSLIKTEAGATISTTSGRMAFELTGSDCEGWGMTFRMASIYGYREGGSRLYDSQTSSFEAGDATNFNYSEKETLDQVPQKDVRIKIIRKTGTAVSEGTILGAKEQSFALPADVLFPTQHQKHLIDMALKGQTHDVSLVYDGSDGEQPSKAITTIGQPAKSNAALNDSNQALVASLKGLRAWPVTIAYFATGDDAAETPTSQISFLMYENGAATNFIIDYGSFAVKGTLSSLTMLKSEACQ